jgi:monofunctional biosynthetic peptidoglycan transglycosylase
MFTVQRRRIVRRVVAGALLAGLGWLVGVWPPPVWWRSHWPTETAMMRLHGGAVRYQPVPLERFPSVLQRMVIIGEDSRFRTHHGLDFEEIRDALGLDRDAGLGAAVRTIWKRRDRLRGASTISQQLAKNFYLSPSRNPLRKLKEAATALRLEAALSKDRILELYLNVVELGPGVWGVPAASEHYFAVSPGTLSETQAAALAATLPFPRSSNPAFRSGRMLHRRDLILARYHGVDVFIPPEEDLDSLPLPPFVPPIVPPVLDSLMRDTLIVPPPLESLPADTLPDSTRDSTRAVAAPQSTRRSGMTRAR